MRTKLLVPTALLLLLAWPAACHAAAQVVRAASVPPQLSLSGAGNSHSPVFSADGRSVAFLSQANNLATDDDVGPHLDLFLRDLVTSNTVLLSVSTNGAGGANDNIREVALSSNAWVVAFETAGSNLAPGDTNRCSDIYVRDRISGTTALVSVNASGIGSGNGPSSNPLISEGGRYVIFESLASNLVTNDFNGTNDIFVRDLEAGTTSLVSVNADGSASPDGCSHSPAASASGGVVAFVSHATNLVAGVTNRLGEIYVRHVFAGSNQWLAASAIPATYHPSPPGPTFSSYRASSPAVTSDGRFVAFTTGSGAVVRFDTSGPTNWSTKLYNDGGNTPSNNVYYFLENPRIHRFHAGTLQAPLAFSSNGRFLAATVGRESSTIISRIDFDTDESECCAGCCDGNGAGFNSYEFSDAELVSTNLITNAFWGSLSQPLTAVAPSMSANGQRIAFLAGTRPALSGLLTEPLGLFLHDMSTNAAFLVGGNRAGVPGPDLADIVPAISPDGSRVAWDSPDENIVSSDSNRAWDVFVRDVETGGTALVSARAPGAPASTGPALSRLGPTSLSSDGSRLAVLFHDSTLAPNDTNNRTDLILRNLAASSNQSITLPQLIQPIPLVYPPVTLHAAAPMFSANGRYLVFAGEGDLSQGNFITNLTLFWRDTVAATNRVVASGSSISYPVVSPDGRFVAFHSRDPLDYFSDGNGLHDVFEYEFVLDTGLPAGPRNPWLVSATPLGQAANGASSNPRYSPDGVWILFQSLASNLTSDFNTNPPSAQLFARKRLNTVTNFLPNAPLYDVARLVSYTTVANPALSGTSVQRPLAGAPANPVFSGDSRYVVFENGASNVIYRHDLLGGYVTSLTPHPEGSFTSYFTNRARVTNDLVCTGCANPSVNGDGTVVAYETRRGAGATNDVLVKDLVTGLAELVSATPAGAGGNNSSFAPLVSHDARYVVFASRASDLVADDHNRATDIFVRDRLGAVTHCVSRNLAGTATGNRVSSNPVLSADGRTIAFQSFASDLAAGDYNDTRDVFVLTLAGPDTDGDSLDDDWEMTYFDTLARNGSGDFDEDGQSDKAEFRAGTNPSNNASVLRVLSIISSLLPSTQIDYRHTTLLWTAVPGKTYRVQFKQDFSAPWTNLAGDVIAGGTTGSKTHALFSPPARIFYRVMLVP